MNLTKFSVASLALATAFAISPAAKADTIDTFTLTDSLVDGGTASGTYSVDVTNGSVTASDITVTDGAITDVFNDPFGHGGTGNDPFEEIIFTTTGGFSGDYLVLALPGTTPDVGYSGGFCDTTSTNCSGVSSYVDEVSTSTKVNLGPATPEPNSLLLLGTGLVGLAGVARRRFRKT